MKHTLKEMVSGHCNFLFYRNGSLYYVLSVLTEGTQEEFEYIFPIDVTDTKEIGSATFNRNEKSLLFMRYIRKAIKENTIAKYKGD